MTGAFDLQDVLFYGGCTFTIMRCMSFALESSQREEGIYSIFDLLKYNFYLPFFFFGPVMTFDQFHAQVSDPEATLEQGFSPEFICSGLMSTKKPPTFATVKVQMVVAFFVVTSSLWLCIIVGKGIN